MALPGDIGVLALADAGRVYLNGESSDTWHTGVGGGVWLAFLDPANTIAVSLARGDGRTALYARRIRLLRPAMRRATPAPRLIGRPVPDTPGTISRAGRRRTLPDDLLRQASRRIEILALTASVLWVLGPVLAHIVLHATDPDNPRWAQFGDVDYIAAASVVVSLALFAYLRTGDRDPARVMDIGLVYMVATACALGVLLHLTSAAAGMVNLNPMITWIGPVILMFAAIVPAAPGKMLVASGAGHRGRNRPWGRGRGNPA